jgi:hypothetical protein
MDEVAQPAADLSATDFYELAEDRLRVGETAEAIENELLARGLGASAAKRVVEAAQATRKRKALTVGRRNMIFGAVAFVGGIAATALTYSQAVNNGGIYYVFWAAIAFGAVQFVWGALQLRGM